MAVFTYWLRVSKLSDQGTENEHYFKQKVIFAASFIVQITMSTADIAIGCAIAAKVSKSGDLRGLCVFAITAG